MYSTVQYGVPYQPYLPGEVPLAGPFVWAVPGASLASLALCAPAAQVYLWNAGADLPGLRVMMMDHSHSNNDNSVHHTCSRVTSASAQMAVVQV